MADQTLTAARIAFHLPHGYHKSRGVAMKVHVATKSDNQPEIELAARQGFADTEEWKDDGQHTYTYQLNVAPIGLSHVDGELKTTIEIIPKDNNIVMFDYKVSLIFDDGDPSTAQIELTQNRSGVVLSQNNRKFYSWCIFKRPQPSAFAADWAPLLWGSEGFRRDVCW